MNVFSVSLERKHISANKSPHSICLQCTAKHYSENLCLGNFCQLNRIPRIILNLITAHHHTNSIEIGGCPSFKGNTCQPRGTNGFWNKNPKSNSCLWPTMSDADCGESIPSNNLANRHVVLKTGLLLSRAAALQWNLHTDRTLLSGSAVSCELAGWKAPMPEAFNEDLNRPWLINPIVNRARADSVNTGKGREWNKTDVKKKKSLYLFGHN